MCSSYPATSLNWRETFGLLLLPTLVTVDELLFPTYDYYMSTAREGTGKPLNQYDPEDVRIGQTLQALMYREEETPEGFIVRRKINHAELAGAIRLPGRPKGVNRSYISQLCIGAKHMNNDMLFAIARYLGVNPIAIKRPDMDRELVAA